MPNKAFLHKKSLIDKFRDDHKKGTGYIQAARARRTWNNPMTRRKRTNKLNDWITSFAGKRHIRKLSRFNALKESNMKISDKMLADVLAYYKTAYNWSDELIDRERADTMEWLQSYADVFVPAYKNGGTEAGLMAIADAEEIGVGRAELSMMESSKDVGDYTDVVMEIVFDDYGADPEKVIKHLDEILSIIDTDHSKNSLERACAMQIMDYLKSKSEAKDTEEKLGYEKGHKNSRGEDAPWVIRSHKDNRVLASFASEEDAKEHLKRMKQFSKDESMKTPNITNDELRKVITTEKLKTSDQIDKVYSIGHAVLDSGKINYAEYNKLKDLLTFDMDRAYAYLVRKGWMDAFDDNPTETKKLEAVKLTYVDTIRVPQWMWVADQTGDTSDLEDDEIEMLNEFQQEYKDKHLDDKGEDPYFSSRNDFDSLGGNVYDIDVYEMDTKSEKVSKMK